MTPETLKKLEVFIEQRKEYTQAHDACCKEIAQKNKLLRHLSEKVKLLDANFERTNGQ